MTSRMHPTPAEGCRYSHTSKVMVISFSAVAGSRSGCFQWQNIWILSSKFCWLCKLSRALSQESSITMMGPGKEKLGQSSLQKRMSSTSFQWLFFFGGNLGQWFSIYHSVSSWWNKNCHCNRSWHYKRTFQVEHPNLSTPNHFLTYSFSLAFIWTVWLSFTVA